MNHESMIQSDIHEAKQLFMNEAFIDSIDPLFNRVTASLTNVIKEGIDDGLVENTYLFNHEEFVNALEHIVSDQLSVIHQDTITVKEWANRFNRWMAFCDAIINMGMTCVNNKEAIARQDYEAVFSTLTLNKVFETTFLKPRGIKIVLIHKSEQIKDKYHWLAMPCLELKDKEGQVHHVALCTSPNASVWWHETLSGFHTSFNWDYENLIPEEVTSTIDDPNAPLKKNGDGESDGYGPWDHNLA